MSASYWLLLGLALAPHPALPGPWPPEPGRALVISSLESNKHIAHWAEFGLTPRQWLSLQLDFPPYGREMEATMSLHQALPDWHGWKSALSFGLGFRANNPISGPFEPSPVTEIGGSFGRGFETPLPGWLALSGRYRQGKDFRRIKAEATLGLRPTQSLSLIGQLQFGAEQAALRSLQLQGSGLWQLTPALGVELGLSRNLWGQDRRMVGRIASWLRF